MSAGQLNATLLFVNATALRLSAKAKLADCSSETAAISVAAGTANNEVWSEPAAGVLVGRGVGVMVTVGKVVAVGVEVGRGVGVCVGRGVWVAEGVSVGVLVGGGVGVEVADGVTVGRGVGVRVGVVV